MKNPASRWKSSLYLISCIFCCFIISCRSTRSFTDLSLSTRTVSLIDSICEVHLKTHHYPGLAVAVASNGKKVWTRGYGFANIEKGTPVNPAEDLFRVGSISKTVTAAALARMTQRKRIDPDLPITAYYSACPADKSRITARQLGGHLAGIRHYAGLEFFSTIPYSNVTDPLEVFIHDSLLFEPGTRYGYTTYGWTLLSAVMEQAAGTPFLDILQDEVNQPLHLTDLRADHVDSTHYRRVSFYDFKDSMYVLSPKVDNSNKWAGGGLLSSAEEVAIFGSAWLSRGYLKKSTIESFTTSQTTRDGKETQYGIGVRIDTDKNKRRWFGHSGGSAGGTSMLLIYPEEKLVIVTLVNLTQAEMDSLAWKIADILLGTQSH